MQKDDGMNYAPKGSANVVCAPGEFRIAAIGLAHGHIYGMCNGLVEAGAEMAWVYDPDPRKVDAFCSAYPGVRIARSEDEIVSDRSIRLVASAAIPSERGALGERVMESGKDFFSDKPPFTSLAQLESARKKVAETRRKYAVYYSERIHVEAAVYAGQLIREGAVGRVLQVTGFGPHRLDAEKRPPWFWETERHGGILCDLGCHQIEQFLEWTGAKRARVLHSKVGSYGRHAQNLDFEDFGDATLVADNGATHYLRVDWYTPQGLRAWGDGRTFITGTEGTIELRKYVDVGRDAVGDHVYIVDRQGERHMNVHGKIGFPYFGALLRDCMNRTEIAMSQARCFLAIELALLAQRDALRIVTGSHPRG